MTSRPKPIPRFKSERDERRFWETHDSTAYVDWTKAERVSFPNPRTIDHDEFANHVSLTR